MKMSQLDNYIREAEKDGLVEIQVKLALDGETTSADFDVVKTKEVYNYGDEHSADVKIDEVRRYKTPKIIPETAATTTVAISPCIIPKNRDGTRIEIPNPHPLRSVSKRIPRQSTSSKIGAENTAVIIAQVPKPTPGPLLCGSDNTSGSRIICADKSHNTPTSIMLGLKPADECLMPILHLPERIRI